MLIEAEWDLVIMKQGKGRDVWTFALFSTEQREEKKYGVKKGAAAKPSMYNSYDNKSSSWACLSMYRSNKVRWIVWNWNWEAKLCGSFQAFAFPASREDFIFWGGKHTKKMTLYSQPPATERRVGEENRGELRDSRSCAALHCQALGYGLWRKTERQFCPTL